MAISSLVCTVVDKASTQRLEQRASEELQLEKRRKTRATAREKGLKDDLRKTNAAVASMQADLSAAKGWQRGVEEVELRLLARIEEFKAVAEVRQPRPINLSHQ